MTQVTHLLILGSKWVTWQKIGIFIPIKTPKCRLSSAEPNDENYLYIGIYYAAL